MVINGIILMAVGACLRFVVTDPHGLSDAVNLHTCGVILIVVGAAVAVYGLLAPMVRGRR